MRFAAGGYLLGQRRVETRDQDFVHQYQLARGLTRPRDSHRHQKPSAAEMPHPNRIAVTIQGTYTPVLPTFLLMPTSIPIYITAVLGAE